MWRRTRFLPFKGRLKIYKLDFQTASSPSGQYRIQGRVCCPKAMHAFPAA
ncbi:hypothetical protein HMPREF9123_2756 [Neisseria bacilliformis ATCC BAA-1200]|uniref:Uncharacterized protein n=1 Tax=Neisseria bacilliformis ATCC BAA-1200 TaxID=888742 RepID=F2BG99_9NEIS|nr:hypothetical protein HMPREF9123_2756 [Neisseria bacilliformis ATCC BAA-1200]